MVLKHFHYNNAVHSLFENDVKTYGTQAVIHLAIWFFPFENDVKTYGTQAGFAITTMLTAFENDVKTYGTQAFNFCYTSI